MFISHIAYGLVTLSALAGALPSAPALAQKSQQLVARDGKVRKVFLHFEYIPGTITTGSDGKTTFPSHSALYVAGNNKDGPLTIEIEIKNGEYHLSYYDMTPRLTDVGNEPRGAVKKVFYQGTTTLTNDQFLDAQGNGIVWEELTKDSQYRSGEPNKGKLNTCHDVNTRILNRLNIAITPDAKELFDLYDTWSITIEKKDITKPIKTIAVKAPDRNPRKKTSVIVKHHAIDDGAPGKSGCKRNAKRSDSCTPKPITSEGDGNFGVMQNELAGYEIMSHVPPEQLDAASSEPDTTESPGKSVPPNTVSDDKGNSKLSIVRAGGTLTSFTAVGREALGALGIAGSIVGAAFVILDFVNHDWVGGAIGAVGLAVGVAAGLAVSGPLGWVIGGAIAALFAILPSLFEKAKPPADRTDPQGIIQWKLFGDKTHTGNEQCQQGTKDVPGNKDCQALYGPGTLSMALEMNNFDAIVFLQQFNDGYPMSIKEIAAAFYVVDETKKGDGNDKMATITCHNEKPVSAGRAGAVGGHSPKVCDKPEFKINRQLIHLPTFDTTADQLINRIIPAPNGDCKLIARPGDQYFPDYMITINGLPSAIACGLTAAINVDGTAVPIVNDQNGQKPQLGSDPGQSTDGQGGATVAPPPPAPFKPLAQTDYACLIHANDAPFCLPPGAYHKQSGLGFEISRVDSLTLPLGGAWSLATHWKQMPQPHEPGQRYADRTYKVNQDPKKASRELSTYQDDMKAIDMDVNGEATFTVIGPGDGPDPVCCLFTEAKFGGNVWCVGVGGGDTLPQWKKQAQSVSCHNGGQVWIYAKEYGDAGGALIKGNVEDLADEPFGDKDSFSKKVVALWVSKG